MAVLDERYRTAGSIDIAMPLVGSYLKRRYLENTGQQNFPIDRSRCTKPGKVNVNPKGTKEKLWLALAFQSPENQPRYN